MFAVVLTRATRAPPQSFAAPDAMLRALTPFDQADRHGQWSDGRASVVQGLTWNTPQSRAEATPEVCGDTGRIIASWVRLDNRAALCRDLRLTEVPTLSDPQLILAAHRAWGEACADRLEGDFSFVIYDPATGHGFCARDSLGARPFFYYADAEVFIAASTAAVFKALAGLAIAPSDDWIARFMADAPRTMTQSAFDGVLRLAPGHHMHVDRDGPLTPTCYFAFEDAAPVADYRDPAYVAAYREAFHRATEVRLTSDFLVGAESTGGLDSSSIVAHAVNHLPHPIEDFHCFATCALSEEPKYMLATALHCGVRNTHVASHTHPHGNPDDDARIITALGHPPENSHAQWQTPFLKQCEPLGIRTLLSGYGGDELVTNHAPTLQRELFDNRQYAALFRDMPGNALVRALRFGVRARRMARAQTTPSRLGIEVARELAQLSLLRDDVLEAFDLEELSVAGYRHQAGARSLNDHILRAPMFTPRRVARLESCVLYAASHKVEYRWPLFDRQLMQQYLRTPAIEKRNQTMGRYLHRRAVAGTIPDIITAKRTKDMGEVTVRLSDFGLPENLRETALPSQLGALLDFDKIASAQSDLRQARENAAWTRVSVRQMNALWRVSQLADWLR